MFYSARGLGWEVALLFVIPSCVLLCSARCIPAHHRAHVGIRPRLPMTTTTMPLPHHHPPQAIYRLRCHRLGRTAPIPPLLFLLLFSLLCSAKAQSSASSSRDQYGNLRGGFGPAMGILVVILISAFFLVVFFSIYLRQCNERDDPSVRPSGAAGRILQGGARSRRSAARGLDPAVVEAFPTLVYAEVKDHKIGKGALECAVCLSEFEDEEALRLLPRCDHVFHTDCIDAWLSSHTTCPVCRCNLAAPDLNATEASTVSLPADGGTSSTAAISEEADQREGGAGGVQLQEHVAIVVEEPEAGQRLKRMESKSRLRWRWSGSLPRFPRSHSTGHSIGVVRQSEDCERYTLRLPDHIRRDLMAGKFQRSSSCAAGEGSSTRKGHRAGDEGTSSSAGGAAGGRSFQLRRWEWAAKSDRWAFFARTLSMVVSRSDDGRTGGGSARRGECSSGKAAEGGEGSVKRKVFPVV